jgi:hypothetical protein
MTYLLKRLRYTLRFFADGWEFGPVVALKAARLGWKIHGYIHREAQRIAGGVKSGH